MRCEGAQTWNSFLPKRSSFSPFLLQSSYRNTSKLGEGNPNARAVDKGLCPIKETKSTHNSSIHSPTTHESSNLKSRPSLHSPSWIAVKLSFFTITRRWLIRYWINLKTPSSMIQITKCCNPRESFAFSPIFSMNVTEPLFALHIVRMAAFISLHSFVFSLTSPMNVTDSQRVAVIEPLFAFHIVRCFEW